MTVTLPLADTSDMVALHRVFREALAAAPNLVDGSADPSRATLVADYYDYVLRVLHAHHEGEDELLTPRLVARCTADEAEQVRRVAAQHGAVLQSLAEVEQALAIWRELPGEQIGAALVASLARLQDVLIAHLDEEERLVLPIAAKYINAAEWGEMPAHAMRMFAGDDKIWLVLGLVQDQFDEAQVAEMHAHMPAPLLEFWLGTGRARYAEFTTSLHAG